MSSVAVSESFVDPTHGSCPPVETGGVSGSTLGATASAKSKQVDDDARAFVFNLLRQALDPNDKMDLQLSDVRVLDNSLRLDEGVGLLQVIHNAWVTHTEVELSPETVFQNALLFLGRKYTELTGLDGLAGYEGYTLGVLRDGISGARTCVEQSGFLRLVPRPVDLQMAVTGSESREPFGEGRTLHFAHTPKRDHLYMRCKFALSFGALHPSAPRALPCALAQADAEERTPMNCMRIEGAMEDWDLMMSRVDAIVTVIEDNLRSDLCDARARFEREVREAVGRMRVAVSNIKLLHYMTATPLGFSARIQMLQRAYKFSAAAEGSFRVPDGWLVDLALGARCVPLDLQAPAFVLHLLQENENGVPSRPLSVTLMLAAAQRYGKLHTTVVSLFGTAWESACSRLHLYEMPERVVASASGESAGCGAEESKSGGEEKEEAASHLPSLRMELREALVQLKRAIAEKSKTRARELLSSVFDTETALLSAVENSDWGLASILAERIMVVFDAPSAFGQQQRPRPEALRDDALSRIMSDPAGFSADDGCQGTEYLPCNYDSESENEAEVEVGEEEEEEGEGGGGGDVEKVVSGAADGGSADPSQVAKFYADEMSRSMDRTLCCSGVNGGMNPRIVLEDISQPPRVVKSRRARFSVKDVDGAKASASTAPTRHSASGPVPSASASASDPTPRGVSIAGAEVVSTPTFASPLPISGSTRPRVISTGEITGLTPTALMQLQAWALNAMLSGSAQLDMTALTTINPRTWDTDACAIEVRVVRRDACVVFAAR